MVHKPRGTVGVEPHHPVAHDLQRHPADPGGLAACATIVDRGQRQQAPHLRSIFRGLGCCPHLRGIEVSPKRDGHREPQPFATLNQIAATLNSQESGFQELGISLSGASQRHVDGRLRSADYTNVSAGVAERFDHAANRVDCALIVGVRLNRSAGFVSSQGLI